MSVDDSELEELMEKAGVDGEVAKKLRAANATSEEAGTRGHGATAPTTRAAGQL